MSQQPIDFSRKITEAHIQIAEDHANAVHLSWSDKAMDYLKWYISSIEKDKEFLAEDVREYAGTLVPEPPSLRAWGAIILKAAKMGLIKKVGHRAVKNANAHRAFASVWRRT